MISQKTLRRVAIILTLALGVVGIYRAAIAAQLTLTWSDNSSNENGFNVERRVGTTGIYAQLASVGVNVASYTDTNLQTNTTYCYRVRAYNLIGSSAYSNEGCATTLTADTTAPVRSNGAPSGTLAAGTTQTTLRLTTNKKATCRYATSAGVAYGSMPKKFATTGGTAHSTTVSGLTNGGNYNYFVRCRDTVGNANTNDFTISFSVASSQQTSYRASVDFSSTFVNDLVDKVGIYRPSTGEWFLDQNGSGIWDGCEIDICVQSFSAVGALPVVGDWDGSEFTKLGLFLPSTSQWQLDLNGDYTWDGCALDQCQESFGGSADMPVAGKWTTPGSDRIGTFRTDNGTWYLDASGNGNLDCSWDYCFRFSNYANGDIPVAGDWTGSGTSRVGLYRPSTGQWFLDSNGSRSLNSCSKDTCVNDFGAPGDLPITGDWSGNGISKIGIFRPSTQEWTLDLNGNGSWDGCDVDLCISGFGAEGDVPVVGRW